MSRPLLDARASVRDAALKLLPADTISPDGRNGEGLAHDEASVWKRVLNLRLVEWMRPRVVLETHPGLGVSTYLYERGCGNVMSWSDSDAPQRIPSCSIVDVDPFGAPWGTLEAIQPLIRAQTVLLVSNGEAQAVHRNLRKAQRYPTRYYGRRLPQWVTKEYLPRLESLTGCDVRFFYAFPTTVRAVLSRRSLPRMLWKGCPRWMWWLRKYAAGDE